MTAKVVADEHMAALRPDAGFPPVGPGDILGDGSSTNRRSAS